MVKPESLKKPRKHLLGIYLVLGIIPIVILVGIIIYLINRPVNATNTTQILFKDDLNSYKTGAIVSGIGGWQDVSQLLNNNDSRLKSKWFYSVGKVYHEPNIPADYTDVSKLFLGTLVVNGDSKWTNYALEVRTEPLDEEGFGLVFRYQDINNFYRLLVVKNQDNGGPYIKFEKKLNGTVTTISQSNSANSFLNTLQVGNWYRIKLVINQSTLEAFVDGQKILSGNDSALISGKIGLWSFEQSGVFFDDVIVTKLN